MSIESKEVKEYNTTKVQRDSFPPIVLVKLDCIDWFCFRNPVTGLYWKSNLRRPGANRFVVGGWSKNPANMSTTRKAPQM